MFRFVLLLFVGLAVATRGAELSFDFGQRGTGTLPYGFRSTVSGSGKPGEWKIRLEEDTPLLPPISPQAENVTKKPVLAQMARDATDAHYPMLVYEPEIFGDFKLETRFKIVDGNVEQMAGVAFRIQDEKNYYYVRASSLGSTFYFWKMVNGELIGPIGAKVPIEKGVWHDLSVECKGSQISCSLNGKVLIPGMQQNDFPRGKIGFWTKSDAVSYFADTKITFTPLEAPAEGIVRDVLKKYPRLLGLKLYIREGAAGTKLIASDTPAEQNQPGGKTEEAVLRTGEIWFGKEKDQVSVIMPVRDRNGDPIAAARVVMKSFPGQTEQNAIVRATPVVRRIQDKVNTMEDLVN